MRKNRDYKPEPRKFNHVQAVLQILSVMIGDHRYEETMGNEAEGDLTDMCEVLDRVEKNGREKAARQSDKNMYEDGVKIEKISQYLGFTVDTITKWLGLAPAMK